MRQCKIPVQVSVVTAPAGHGDSFISCRNSAERRQPLYALAARFGLFDQAACWERTSR